MKTKEFRESKSLLIISAVFVLFIFLRIFFAFSPGADSYNIRIWAMSYNVVALLGAIYGFYLSESWGGYKSMLGRVILIFSCGLFLQSFGQNVYNYLYVTQGFDIEPPYPGLGDVGFFGSIIFYVYGAILLSKLSGVKLSLESLISKIQLVLIPLFLLIASYLIFLKGYEFDVSNKLKILLDFGYPLGQAFYVSVVILTLIFTRKVLGGFLKVPILFFLVALISQYLADFIFLLEVNNGTFVVGGLADCMYFVSYFLMAISLIRLGATLKVIKNTN